MLRWTEQIKLDTRLGTDQTGINISSFSFVFRQCDQTSKQISGRVSRLQLGNMIWINIRYGRFRQAGPQTGGMTGRQGLTCRSGADTASGAQARHRLFTLGLRLLLRHGSLGCTDNIGPVITHRSQH